MCDYKRFYFVVMGLKKKVFLFVSGGTPPPKSAVLLQSVAHGWESLSRQINASFSIFSSYVIVAIRKCAQGISEVCRPRMPRLKDTNNRIANYIWILDTANGASAKLALCYRSDW
jgi:hypothetical protein